MSITVTIDSVDRTSSVAARSLKIVDNLNQQVDNLSFIVKKYGSLTYTPELGDVVVVTKDATTVFGGVIVKIGEVVSARNVIQYEVQCNDYSQFLRRQLVTERYTSQSVNAIIADIVTTYTSDGITDNDVDAPVVIDSISFNRLTVAECLQKLANALSYVWYVDASKSIHFFAKNTELAPFNLTDSSNNYIYDSLQITTDLTQVKNSVLVQGGEATSETTRTEYFSGDTTRTFFALANKFASVPTVTVGGVGKTVGTENIDDEASFQFMWNFNEKYIRSTTGNTPGSGTNNVVVTGYYLYPIVVQVPSPASITTYGTYEFAITDKSIVSQDEAINRALAELTAYQNELSEGSFSTYTDGLRSGQTITITSTQRNKNISVVIQSITASVHDATGDVFRYDVKFATLKTLGIIQYLQSQLLQKEIIVDDQETILSVKPFTDSDIILTDTISTPTASTGPYKWAGSNVVIDSYSETNQDATGAFNATTTRMGQTFTVSTEIILDRAVFYLKKTGSPTGNAVAKIYALSGTPGTNGTPTGAALATSDNFDAATLTTSYALTTFQFSGAQKITLAAGSYGVSIEHTGDASNHLDMGLDNSSASHSGNRFTWNGVSWTSSSVDACFYVYGDYNNLVWGYGTWS